MLCSSSSGPQHLPSRDSSFNMYAGSVQRQRQPADRSRWKQAGEHMRQLSFRVQQHTPRLPRAFAIVWACFVAVLRLPFQVQPTAQLAGILCSQDHNVGQQRLAYAFEDLRTCSAETRIIAALSVCFTIGDLALTYALASLDSGVAMFAEVCT